VEPNPPRPSRYIAGWVAMALGLAALLVALTGAPPPLTLTTLVLLATAAAAERIELDFYFDERAGASYSLSEAAIVAALLLLPPSHVVFIGTVEVIVVSLSRRLSADKILYNAAQMMASAAVAAATLWAFPAVGPTVADRPVLGALAAMLAYAVVNTASMAGLMVRLGGREMLDAVRRQIPMGLAATLGATSVGIVGAALWVTNPWLVPLLLAPVGAIHLAARGQLRAATLLERLRSDHDRLTRIVDGAQDGILLLDREGTVQVWNPAMETLTGLPADRVIGRRIERVLTDTVREADRPVRGRWVVEQAHTGATRRELDASLRHIDGSLREVRETHSLVFDERGRCTGDVVVVRDVSRQRELERLRGDFVARVSHELRTPLTPIRGFASILLRRGENLGQEQRRDALERIVERADHLGNLVEDLLLVTRLDRHDLDGMVHPRPSAITPELERAIGNVRNRDPKRTFSLQVTPGTGDAHADPDRVRQVVEVLLDNACQYSPADSPIELELDQVGDDVRVRVIDHGPGIPREQRQAIFEQFHRLEDPLTMQTGGVGLGLFIGRRLAEAMHGSLEVDDPGTGRGSVFVLRLPAAEPVMQAQGGSVGA
jgi:PAS domain S-box-containing protein